MSSGPKLQSLTGGFNSGGRLLTKLCRTDDIMQYVQQRWCLHSLTAFISIGWYQLILVLETRYQHHHWRTLWLILVKLTELNLLRHYEIHSIFGAFGPQSTRFKSLIDDVMHVYVTLMESWSIFGLLLRWASSWMYQGKQCQVNHLQTNRTRQTGRFHSNDQWREREPARDRGLSSCPGANCPAWRLFFFPTLHFPSDSYSWSISPDCGCWLLLNCLVSLLLTNHTACQLGA